MKRLLLTLSLLIAFAAQAAPWAPSSDRMPPSWEPHRTDGTGTGIPGGIPSRSGGTLRNVTASPYNADSTGATDASAAVQAAVDASSAGDVVYMPAGTYKFTGTVGIKSGVTVRGDGTDEPGQVGMTKIDARDRQAFYNGTDDTFGGSGVAVVSASLTKGASTIEVADTFDFRAGRLAMIRIPNSTDPDFPVFKADEDNLYVRDFIVYVTAVTDSTHLQIYPKLFADFSSYSGARAIAGGYGTVSGVGIEDLLIDMVNNADSHSRGVHWTSGVIDSWLKNVKVINHRRYGWFIQHAVRIEISGCRVGTSHPSGALGTNHSGMLLQWINGMLMEDTLATENGPNVEINFGVVASAFAHNYIDSGVTINGYDGQSFVINHGPWNSHNLVEGNYFSWLLDDGYFGGSSENTYFRNWFSGLSADPSGGDARKVGPFFINRFSRNNNIVGNVLQSPGFSWSSPGINLGFPYGGSVLLDGSGAQVTINPSLGTFWNDYDSATGKPKGFVVTLTSKSDAYNGVATAANSTIADQLEASLADSEGGNYPRLRTGFNQKWVYFGPRVGNTWTVNSNGSGTSGQDIGGVGDSHTTYASAGGFREIDGGVAYTAVQYYNFSFNDSAQGLIAGQEFPGGTTLGESLMGYSSGSPPASFVAAGLSYPPYSPEEGPTGAINSSIANIPAGVRALTTVQPKVMAAQWNSAGNQLAVLINKPVSSAGGTGGFAVSADGMTLTYTGVAGSTILFTPSRNIFAGETIDLSYTAASNRWEDTGGNDLQSKSAFHITNLSANQGDNIVFWSATPEESGQTRALSGPGFTAIAPVSITRSGLGNRVTIPIESNIYGSHLKIGIYDSSYNRVSSDYRPAGNVGEVNYLQVTSFPVTPGTYYVAIQSSDNSAPETLTKDTSPATGTARFEFTSYGSFPPATITPEGTPQYSFAFGIEVIPDPIPPTFRVRNASGAIRRR